MNFLIFHFLLGICIFFISKSVTKYNEVGFNSKHLSFNVYRVKFIWLLAIMDLKAYFSRLQSYNQLSIFKFTRKLLKQQGIVITTDVHVLYIELNIQFILFLSYLTSDLFLEFLRLTQMEFKSFASTFHLL